MIEVRNLTDRDEWLAWRKQDVTASAVAALLGAHPYLTAYQLWAEKTNLVTPTETSAAMQRGIELEPLARKWIARENPTWEVRPPNVYLRDVEHRLGATPDVFAKDPEREGLGVVQIKSVEASIYRRNWRDEAGQPTAPLYAVIQAIVEADLAGAEWAAVAALVVSHGIDLHMIDVPLHPELMQRIRNETLDFWRIVEAGQRPALDWKRDADLVAALYEPVGTAIIDMTSSNELIELADERRKKTNDRNILAEELEANKTRILDKLGGASAARLADGRVISVSRVHRKGYPVPPSTFLTLKVKDAP